MNLDALSKKRPELAEAILNVCGGNRGIADLIIVDLAAAAADVATARERERCVAHLTVGATNATAMPLAIGFIKNGAILDEVTCAQYERATTVRERAQLALVHSERSKT